MANYNRIDMFVRATVMCKPKKIAICPFAEDGMLAKQILNYRYGIQETYLIDNRLAEINPNIIRVTDLKKKDTDGLIVLLMIEDREINHLLENALYNLDKSIKIQNYLRPAWSFTPEKLEFFSTIKKYLRVEKPIGDKSFVRLGKSNDGGYVLYDDFAADMTVYSFGIGDNVSFEKELAERGLRINMYDHTITDIPENHENFHFHKLGVSHLDEPENYKMSLSTLLKNNGDVDNHRLILKMDVEGAEWDFLEHVPLMVMNQFLQVTFELHQVTNQDNAQQIISCLEKLNTTHQAVWIHANNIGRIEKATDDLEIPNFVEVTYLNRSAYQTERADCFFPLPIDQPNIPEIQEYIMGKWG